MSNHYNDYDSGQFMLNWDIFFESANLEDDCIYNILLTNRADVTFCSLFLLVFFWFVIVAIVECVCGLAVSCLIFVAH